MTTKGQTDREQQVEIEASGLERDAAALARDAAVMGGNPALEAQSEHLMKAAAAFRQRHIKPKVASIGEVGEALSEASEKAFKQYETFNVEDGRDPQWKATQQDRILKALEDVLLDSEREANARAREIRKEAATTLYNPGEAAERQRGSDLADSELLSRLKYPANRLVAEAEAFLAAGNPRQAGVRIDALRLQGEARTLSSIDLENRVEAALDEAIPHRKAAKELTTKLREEQSQFVVGLESTRVRVELLRGHKEQAARASIRAKLQAVQNAQVEGKPYREPDTGVAGR